jgi:uncharacterized protein
MIFFSSFHESYLWLPVIGLVIGFIASMTGGGGGFFFMPILLLLFNVTVPVAVTTSLAAALPVCLIGSIGHYRRGNIDIPYGLTFVFAGVAGALAGAGLTQLIEPDLLKLIFGIYLIAMAFLMIFGIYKTKGTLVSEKAGKFRMANFSKGSFFGFIGGTITGTFGVSGATPVQAGLFTLRLPVKRVAGTSLLVVLVNTCFALAGHFLIGKIDLTLLLLLTSGTIIGALLGPRLLSGMHVQSFEGSIRRYYAYLVFSLGLIIVLT